MNSPLQIKETGLMNEIVQNMLCSPAPGSPSPSPITPMAASVLWATSEGDSTGVGDSLSSKRKSTSLPSETVEYLKNWMMSPEHIAHPYPTDQEKVQIMAETGIELKQLTNWFVNNRKRYWKPRVEARLRQQQQQQQSYLSPNTPVLTTALIQPAGLIGANVVSSPTTLSELFAASSAAVAAAAAAAASSLLASAQAAKMHDAPLMASLAIPEHSVLIADNKSTPATTLRPLMVTPSRRVSTTSISSSLMELPEISVNSSTVPTLPVLPASCTPLPTTTRAVSERSSNTSASSVSLYSLGSQSMDGDSLESLASSMHAGSSCSCTGDSSRATPTPRMVEWTSVTEDTTTMHENDEVGYEATHISPVSTRSTRKRSCSISDDEEIHPVELFTLPAMSVESGESVVRTDDSDLDLKEELTIAQQRTECNVDEGDILKPRPKYRRMSFHAFRDACQSAKNGWDDTALPSLEEAAYLFGYVR